MAAAAGAVCSGAQTKGGKATVTWGHAHLEQAGSALAQAPQELWRDVRGAALAQARVRELLHARQRQAGPVWGMQHPLPQRLQDRLDLLLGVPLRMTGLDILMIAGVRGRCMSVWTVAVCCNAGPLPQQSRSRQRCLQDAMQHLLFVFYSCTLALMSSRADVSS